MTDDLVKRLRDRATTGYYTLHHEAADRIEALEAAQAWRPIETAPRDGRDVLVVTELRMVRVAFFDTARGGIWSLWPGREPTMPDYWLPLPQPPGGDNE